MFVNGHSAKLDKLSRLENFPHCIRSAAIENQQVLLGELKQKQLYKPTGRPPFSASMIRFALHLRHASLQGYKLLLEKFPMPSMSLLNKVKQSGVDSLKALKVLREKGEISIDLILMADEIDLQKVAQYQDGEYVGADEESNLYKGIIAFMVVVMKQSITFVVQAIPEVTFNGQWLCNKVASNIENLGNAGFCLRGLVADNHTIILMLLLHLKIFLIPNQSYFWVFS